MNSSLRFLASVSAACFAVVFLWADIGRADVKLPPVFGDHMVLQRAAAVPVWGQALPSEEVTVKFRDQEKKATADAKGAWRVELAPLTVGGPETMTISGKNKILLENVLVGEVWVGSGQSNMQGGVSGYAHLDEVLAKWAAGAPYAKLRLAHAGGWQEATPKNLDGFSAILFAFGLKLQQELDVPVGLMLGAAGGTPSGAWLSEAALADDAECQKLIAVQAANYDDVLKTFNAKTLPEFEKQAAAAKAAGKTVPKAPVAPPKPGTVNGRPVGYLYEAHIRPFVGYRIRGVLWDQGESGTAVGGVDQYMLMGALIRGWRKEWNQGDFPFIYVQKASGGGCAWDPTDPVTAKGEPFQPLPPTVPADGQYLETHVRIMNYPQTGMAISSDLGLGVHPVNKSGYGQRSAAVALGMVYKKPVAYYGPKYESHEVAGGKVRVKFSHVGQGLAWKHGERLQGFAVAGEDRKFLWATAEIDGDSVVLTCQEVPQPTAVRYAWSGKRTWANLFNKDGLPAIPFRTDAW